MADITAQTLVSAALKMCGAIAAGVAPQQADLDDALLQLNMMVSQWQRRRWLVYRLADLSCLSTGAPAYSVGPNGDIAVDVRPDQIAGAYCRLLRGGPAATGADYSGADTQAGLTPANLGYGGGLQPLDYPLSVIRSREDFSNIGMKGLSTWPVAVYLDPDIPMAGLYLWPIPVPGIWEIHVLVKQSLEGMTLAGNLGLPPEYQEALMYNLALRLRPSYGLDPDAVVSSLAAASLATIRASNSAIKRISPNVPRGGRGGTYWPGLETNNMTGSGIGTLGIGTGTI